MGRVIPVALVVAAAAADGAGMHGVAFYALLAAVPAVAAAALGAYGAAVERGTSRLHASLWGVVLGLTVVGAAVRAPVLDEGTVPALARSAVVACLGIFCAEAIAGLVGELRRNMGPARAPRGGGGLGTVPGVGAPERDPTVPIV
jgi:hypothetical protein